MEDHDSPEAVAARANQEDPIIMYLIVRVSLEMSVGKIAAQCGHAVGMLESKFNELDRQGFSGWHEPGDLAIYQHWKNNSFRKVVLAGKEKDWEKLKASILQRVVVVDAGLTEITPGSETVIGLWPMHKSQAPKAVQRCQVLK